MVSFQIFLLIFCDVKITAHTKPIQKKTGSVSNFSSKYLPPKTPMAIAMPISSPTAAKRGRRVTRDCWEAARSRHQARMQQEAAKERYKRRQHYGETPFAVLKAVMILRRFLLRGIDGVRQEWLWSCTAFNLKKLITLSAPCAQSPESPVPMAV